ncbi:hypothetical protein KSP40_PGU004653 [Platanthera guangdongensis]|uniref:Uncharacterized protein n=1 Tax=Platanthera guangdongensis TaxID=2320717 RepID=A0ABR2MDP8_9ASPA
MRTPSRPSKILPQALSPAKSQQLGAANCDASSSTSRRLTILYSRPRSSIGHRRPRHLSLAPVRPCRTRGIVDLNTLFWNPIPTSTRDHNPPVVALSWHTLDWHRHQRKSSVSQLWVLFARLD